jgi:hypothetical protein
MEAPYTHNSQPALHDIARGTGCGDDDDLYVHDIADDEPFTIEREPADCGCALKGAVAIPCDEHRVSDPIVIAAVERRLHHVHDALCYGTGPWGNEYRCGY